MDTLPTTQFKTVTDAFDYKGFPAERSKTGGWTSASMILGGEVMERLTTLGITVNLVTYLTGTMHLGNAASANIVTNFVGTSFMLCLFGGFLGDTYVGSKYRFKKPVGSPLTQIAVVFVAAWRKRNLQLPSDSTLLFNDDDVLHEPPKIKKQRLPHSKQFRFLDKAAIKDSENAGTITKINKWYLSTLTDVEEVKLVLRMLPIWASTIVFWTVQVQMMTLSVSQATTMDRHIGKSFQIPAASMTSFLIATILLTVPFYDRFISPIARKVLKNPQGLSPLQHTGVGLALSILSMVAAALVEEKRIMFARSHGLANNPTANIPLSVFWLVPQFFIVGSGEAFMYMGQLDFFLRECPDGMKTMSMGLFLSSRSLGFFFSSLLVSTVNKLTGPNEPWIANNLNQGRLYNYYWLLAMLSVINLFIYLACAKWYVYKDKKLAEEGIEE
ncbi:hypothetical protein TSUD_231490 [Trifolium subterraneum]|nr:hypothetical protein TSUD_231490 [Trifolium subterraneum]